MVVGIGFSGDAEAVRQRGDAGCGHLGQRRGVRMLERQRTGARGCQDGRIRLAQFLGKIGVLWPS